MYLLNTFLESWPYRVRQFYVNRATNIYTNIFVKGPRLNKELTQWLDEVPPTTVDGVPIPVPGARAIIAP